MFSRKKQSAVIMVMAGLVVAAMILGTLSALLSSAGRSGDDDGGDDRGPDPGSEQRLEPIPADDPVHDLVRRDPDDPLALGEVDAPIVMIEYADFQCAFCGGFARDTRPQLIEEYVDTGVLRIEFRNFPIYGPESDNAARAAWAAGRQGMFWEFYEAAYAEDEHRGSGRYSDEGVLALAEQAQVPDLERFAEDLDSEEAGAAVGVDAEEGFRLGITSTPGFLINGHAILGGQPIDVFRSTIDQLHAAERQN
jgi:protein-disulfide isomerase